MLTAPARFKPERNDWIQAGLVAVALLVLYALSAPRTVSGEDDGLFILSTYFLGIEHPPGYPLFTLLAHPFTYLPFGSVAYRVHLASAFFGGLTGGAVWMCARVLISGRLPAYVAALGLGVCSVFWSQATIAEVYTLNTFLFLVVVYLGLQVCPPDASGQRLDSPHVLPWMALVFGLSLSDHYPLMLLVAPSFVVLLWPLRQEILRRLPVLLWLVIIGLLPYAWMVYRSWQAIPISFYGPLDTLPEIWFFISRAGYAAMDQSATANWLDRIKLFEFLAGQLVIQFAVVGTLLAAVGFAVQWRVLGRRVSAFMTVAFLMPSAGLLVALNFDYDSMHKHIYHVYPLPAYAVAALWMGLGFSWLVNRFALRAVHAAVLCTALIAAVFAGGVKENLLDDDWIARYAQILLKTIPKDAVVFGLGDPDLIPMAYFHMIENQRPDITLYHSQGLVLGNRLFHSQRTDEETAQRILREMVEEQTTPVVSTMGAYSLGAQRDRWLYKERDPSSSEPKSVKVDIPEEAVRFFEESVVQTHSSNAWVAVVQGELRRQYGSLLARSLPRGHSIDSRTLRDLELLGKDFYGALGVAEGLMLNENGYSAGVVASYLDKARDLMPSDVLKEYLARYFHLRGALRTNAGDRAGGIEDMETALSIWRTPKNPAIDSLEKIYRDDGNSAALNALQDRVKTFKRQRP